MVVLIPVAYFLSSDGRGLVFLFAHFLHLSLSIVYAQALGMNGRSSSILACLKPYRLQMIPVILHVPYSVPVRSISILEDKKEIVE